VFPSPPPLGERRNYAWTEKRNTGSLHTASIFSVLPFGHIELVADRRDLFLFTYNNY
jgi:hypothetical protein